MFNYSYGSISYENIQPLTIFYLNIAHNYSSIFNNIFSTYGIYYSLIYC